MITLLFVDDEPQVLQGLRRSLRHRRHQWTMLFAEGGEEALAQMRHQAVDIVVTDIRMPRMSGVELLRLARKEFPNTARIALSGYTEQHDLSQISVHAHRFLAKPCPAEQLEACIEEILEMRLWGEDGEGRRIVEAAELPPVPRLYRELLDLLGAPDTSLADVASVIRCDGVMSAKVLKIVNSAFFGLPRKMSDVQQAVTYLGTSVVKDLVLSAGLFAQLEPPGACALSLEAVQSHSLEVACRARTLLSDREAADLAFTVGVVHDIGRGVLARHDPQGYAQVIARIRAGTPAIEAERELLGIGHDSVGAALLGMWGLPPDIVKAVAQHHGWRDPARSSSADAASAVRVVDTWLRDPVAGVALAEALGFDPRSL